ncbi:FAD:protein FMN transferase [Aquihabitans sp. McL0605]|uniref:FAD:protein FMN transferase n=1 Tax=Aquihabitans sp. McL0605 TaxID=3415671 RepID=UPI003CF804B4
MHQPVMGTDLELQITAASVAAARAAEADLVTEAKRLEAVFTVFDPGSDLCAWRSGAVAEAGPELARLLAIAAFWQVRSGGAFNPLTRVLTDCWHRAEREQVPPSRGELAVVAGSIAAPAFAVTEGGGIERRRACDHLDLNAVAKGHVVDLLATRALARDGVERVVVNAGGDLLHRGTGTLRVGVEDPHHAYDNVPPLLTVLVADGAVATSGRARRWFQVDGQRRSRVLDPRTGWPVEHGASATVIAPDAATADVVATVASVLVPPEAVAFVDGLAGDGIDAACLVIDAGGGRHRSARWPADEAPA